MAGFLGPLLRWWPRPGLVEPQYEVFAVSPISAGGGLDDIHPMRRGGVKSFVDDLVLGRGVVISRAATSLRSVETQPLTRRFVRFRRTHLRFVPSPARAAVGSESGSAWPIRPEFDRVGLCPSAWSACCALCELCGVVWKIMQVRLLPRAYILGQGCPSHPRHQRGAGG